MGWLFYKSLDEQGEISASSSRLHPGLSVDPRMRDTPSRAGRASRARGGGHRGLCVCVVVTHRDFTCSTTGWLLLKHGVSSQGKLSCSERHLC